MMTIKQLKELDVKFIPLSISQSCNPKWNNLEIRHNDKKIFTLSLKEYSCNQDGACSYYETPESCPRDCPSEKMLGKPDAKSETKNGLNAPILNLKWMNIILPLILVIALLIYMELKRRNAKE